MLHLQPAHEDRDLCELHPGDADGVTWDVYAARYGAFNMLQEPERPFALGGESWSVFIQRTRTTVDLLATQFENHTVLAITHAGSSRHASSRWSIYRDQGVARVPGAWIHVGYGMAVFDRRWTLLRYNDMAIHLGAENAKVLLATPWARVRSPSSDAIQNR